MNHVPLMIECPRQRGTSINPDVCTCLAFACPLFGVTFAP